MNVYILSVEIDGYTAHIGVFSDLAKAKTAMHHSIQHFCGEVVNEVFRTDETV
jgi:hypothetical protein